jgi:hypothetical protein
MVKFIALLLFLMLSFAVTLPAEASFCRNFKERSICIPHIKRSAKNYWEYRAAISIDGVARPIELYNCRDRVRVQKDGTVVHFERNDPGEILCNLLKK